jgi:SAM-dependent methyltransferase
MAMYPPSYQGNKLENTIQADPYIKLPGLRFSYGFQFDLIKRYGVPDASILDYGCGTGNFVVNAIHYGFSCDGAEFNEEYVDILQKESVKANFYTINKVLENGFPIKYDVIRLSNVFEHLTNPVEIMTVLQTRLKPGGIILIEGPVEDNFSLAGLFRKVYFFLDKKFRPSRVISGPPYHIFFSNATNQRGFFNQNGFSELYFKTAEAAWPFPASIKEAKGLSKKLMAVIAKISIFFTTVLKNRWGNIFIYTGTLRNK